MQLVLINISDHHTRTRANTGAPAVKVLGCLLGTQSGRTVDISNSFEIKYEGPTAAEGGPVVIDHAFLLKKQDQCEGEGRIGCSASHSEA